MVTQLVAGGVDWRTVSGRAGHADGHMTLGTYAHFQQAQDRGSNTLRAVLQELGWSRTRLVAELRRQAACSGDTLPGTESLIAMVSRRVNNYQQPRDFYRELLARTPWLARVKFFGDEAARLELAAEGEPWLLARALEASSVGKAALKAVGEFACSYPSTAPTVLARPVLEHFRDVTRLLDGRCRWPGGGGWRWSPGTWPGWPAAGVGPARRGQAARDPAPLRNVGVRPIDSLPVDGPPSSAHSGRNYGGRTIQPALRAGRAFARIQKPTCGFAGIRPFTAACLVTCRSDGL